MWRSLWRSIDRFSLQHFRHLADELQGIEFVNELNQEYVVDILRSIVEVVIYGDQHDKLIFECFMEYQILAEFLRVLKISQKSCIEAPLLQYLSIMIQNLTSDHAIYYCFSNEYINNIILHQYGFDGGDLAHYYISFLRTMSGKLNRGTICLLVKVQEDVVVSFPLYCEALKFAQHEEKMIQIAVRALTLNIYNASDGMVYNFLTKSAASEYFLDLVVNLRKKCFHLDALITTATGAYSHEMRKELLLETEKLVDDLYYCNDILQVGEPCLSSLMTQNLLNLLVLPVLLPPLLLSHTTVSHVSAITSLFILSHLLQVVVGKELLNSVAVALLWSAKSDGHKSTDNVALHIDSLTGLIKDMELYIDVPKEVEENATTVFSQFAENISSTSLISVPKGDIQSKRILLRRSRILSLIHSENHSLLLSYLILLIILSESKDLDYSLPYFAGLAEMSARKEPNMDVCTLLSHAIGTDVFATDGPQIVPVLLEVLKKQPPSSVMTQWNAGWVLRKLLICPNKKLNGNNICAFKMSFKLAVERLLKEFAGSWFDYIPLILQKEWKKCKEALEESPQLKDPFVILELSLHKHDPEGDMPPSLSWKSMVNAVKIFVLHHLLDACIYERDSLEVPLQKLISSFGDARGRNGVVDDLSYGTYMSLGNGVPCKVAFSKTEQREVYMIPVAEGLSGKLFLTEKLPLHANRGIVLAMAPLAGLKPETDENHLAWLHLQIREFERSVNANKTRESYADSSDEDCTGRWTLGFPNAEACQVAFSLIKKETDKQRSSVETLLAPFFLNNSLESISDDQVQ